MSVGGEGATAIPGFLAWSPSTRRVAELAARAAPRASTILVTGEHGTGKSRLSSGIARLARGDDAPLVTIDCASLTPDLAENELFGHEAGAYSGASGRAPGKFEAAHGGTALLDRVSDLPLAVQPKLLRVLQERAFERVGGQRPVHVDVLVIATASVDLPAMARRGEFREDLLYRLDVVHFHLPPLRERPEDVLELARLFVEAAAERHGRAARLGGSALQLLAAHSWPGNVRELENVLERVVALTDTDLIDAEALLPSLRRPAGDPEGAVSQLVDAGLSLEAIERLVVARVLRATGGRIGDAAERLGIHRKTLLEKRKRYGLD